MWFELHVVKVSSVMVIIFLHSRVFRWTVWMKDWYSREYDTEIYLLDLFYSDDVIMSSEWYGYHIYENLDGLCMLAMLKTVKGIINRSSVLSSVWIE